MVDRGVLLQLPKFFPLVDVLLILLTRHACTRVHLTSKPWYCMLVDEGSALGNFTPKDPPAATRIPLAVILYCARSGRFNIRRAGDMLTLLWHWIKFIYGYSSFDVTYDTSTLPPVGCLGTCTAPHIPWQCRIAAVPYPSELALL